MLSKNKIKHIKSLYNKKDREETGLFIAEGKKVIDTLLKSNYEIVEILATENIAENYKNQNLIIINDEELNKISGLETPQGVIAVVRQKKRDIEFFNDLNNNDNILVLDFIQDPGNLGTIIRTAEWFGITTIVCSNDTVDCYNPKVVQASAGAIFGVNIFYTDLEKFLQTQMNRTIIGSFLEGEDLYHFTCPKPFILILGNEGHGIRPYLSKFINKRVTISGNKYKLSESLNVAISASIILYQLTKTP